MPVNVFYARFCFFHARRTLCDPTWRNTRVQICPNPDISFFDFDRSLNPSPRVKACRLNLCSCNGYNAMHASSIKAFTVQESVPADVKPTSCTPSLLWTSTTTLCNLACVRGDATLVATPPTVSHLCFSTPCTSTPPTVHKRLPRLHWLSAEKSPKQSKKSRTWHTSSAGGSPWALVPPPQSSGPLDRASKMSHTKGPVRSDMAEQLFSSVKKSSTQ